MSGGRPSSYTQAMADSICERLASGQSLREICRDEESPPKKTVLAWLKVNEEFRSQYTQARADQADRFVEEMIEISDDASNDWMERQEDKGQGYELNGEHLQRSRLRIDTRKWIAARMAPKKYGDRVTTEVVGEGGGPVAATINLTIGPPPPP